MWGRRCAAVALAGVAGLVLAGCELKIGGSDEEGGPSTAQLAGTADQDGQTGPDDEAVEYPGPCPVGDWRLTGLSSNVDLASQPLAISGGGSMTITLREDGTFSLADDGSRPMEVRAEAGGRLATGTITVNGSIEGTYLSAGSDYVFDEDDSQGSATLESTAGNETFDMQEVAGALSPSGRGTVTCSGPALTISTDTVEMTWAYTGGAPGTGDTDGEDDKAAPPETSTGDDGQHQPPSGGVLTVTASGRHDCAGRDVVVNAPPGNRIDLTGTCGLVRVDGGSGVKVVVATANAVEVTGSGNKVEVGQVAQVTVSGSANKVLWGSSPSGSEPAVHNSGIGNVVQRS